MQFANFDFLVIGRGGSKINEIRSQSSCQIRVTDPGTTVPGGAAANPEERLVTITGYPDNINAAVALLYSVCYFLLMFVLDLLLISDVSEWKLNGQSWWNRMPGVCKHDMNNYRSRAAFLRC